MRRRAGTSRVGGRRNSPHQGRFLAVVLLVAVGFAALVGRLGQVQLVGHDDFRAAASAPDTRTLVVPALRGRILDREGRVLADNRASTVVTIERRVIADRSDRGASVVRDVASVLGLPAGDLLGRTWLCGEQGAPAAPACWAGSPQVPVPLAEDVDLDALAADLDGYSAADCSALLREAALAAMRRDVDTAVVTADDVAAARDTVRPSLDPEQVAALKAYRA